MYLVFIYFALFYLVLAKLSFVSYINGYLKMTCVVIFPLIYTVLLYKIGTDLTKIILTLL